jgi:hypothetical protein
MNVAALFVTFAHFGHVLIDAPIFFGPVFVLTLWIVWMGRREKRERGGRQ